MSLTDFLAAAGWDVWVIDIRGNGLADKSSRIDIEQDWNIDDYLVQVRITSHAAGMHVHTPA